MRPLEEDDLDAVLTIERCAFPSPWSLALFQQELRSPISRSWVACGPCRREPGTRDAETETVAGYLCVWMVVDEMHVMNLATHPAYRRLGVARTLLKRALLQAGELGVTRVYLEVRDTNLPAQSLYGSLGFRPVGRRRGYYQDRGEDAIVMAKVLGSGDAVT